MFIPPNTWVPAANYALARNETFSTNLDTKRRVYLERHGSDVTCVNTALATLGRVHFTSRHHDQDFYSVYTVLGIGIPYCKYDIIYDVVNDIVNDIVHNIAIWNGMRCRLRCHLRCYSRRCHIPRHIWFDNFLNKYLLNNWVLKFGKEDIFYKVHVCTWSYEKNFILRCEIVDCVPRAAW